VHPQRIDGSSDRADDGSDWSTLALALAGDALAAGTAAFAGVRRRRTSRSRGGAS
jgi:hypothetical protein